MKSLFHVSYHVTDLETSRNFYGNILGCKEGRASETYVDYDFFGHQISLHKGVPFPTTRTGKVGDHEVLMPHIGASLTLCSSGRWTGSAVKVCCQHSSICNGWTLMA